MFTIGKRVEWVKQAALLCLLGGCGTIADLGHARIEDADPVAWWHSLEGGAISERRPDPPGANDPYPNLASVPARPTPTPAAQRVALTAQLVAERDGVRRDVARDPLTAAPAAASAPRKPVDPASVPPPMATIDAATAPPAPLAPAPPAPPTPAPTTSAAAPTLLPDRVPAPPRKQSGRAPQPSGPMPDLPAAPPSAPVLPGIPAATFAPATRRPLPSVTIAFARDADQLPPTAAAILQGLADRRGGGPVLVYAGGDASSAAPAAQGSALALALRRAGAISRALAAAGVPPAQTRTEATALGRDSGARLVD